MRKSGIAAKAVSTLFVIALVFISKSLAGTAIQAIDTAKLHTMVVDNAYRLEAGRAIKFLIIDARTKAEYDKAHIFSAISVPEKDFEESACLLPKDKGAAIVVYDNGMKFGTCVKWAGKAATAGYTNVVIYSEGFPAWKENKMPVAPL